MSATITSEPVRAHGYFKNPWRRPRFLQAVTIGYLLWSMLPVLIAVIFSFNDGRSRVTWQGPSLRWWTGDPTNSLFHDTAMRAAMAQTYKLSILTVLVAVPCVLVPWRWLGTVAVLGLLATESTSSRSVMIPIGQVSRSITIAEPTLRVRIARAA